jgi:hypothetical protein
MILIPGWLVALLTFPGVVCHEVAHRFFCDLAGVPVYSVCYIRLGNPCGYVVHGPLTSLRSAFLISVGPLIVNTTLCSLLSFSAAIPIIILNVAHPSIASCLLFWIAISIGMHSFPSNADIANFNAVVKSQANRGLPLYVGQYFGLVFAVANVLRIVWFDVIYAVLVAMVPLGLLLYAVR